MMRSAIAYGIGLALGGYISATVRFNSREFWWYWGVSVAAWALTDLLCTLWRRSAR